MALLVGEASAQLQDILDTQVGAYPFSIHRGAASTRDGRYLYLGEGGSIAVLDTSLANGMTDELKRPTVGKRGAVPVRLILDPNAADVPDEGPDDVLYLAAGRDGLWVMSADLGAQDDNFAARVDDSGNLVKETQNSRRWCVDVACFELGNDRYLAALFQRLDQSRLRIYPISQVQGVLTGGLETGNEIEAMLQVKLKKRPGFNPPQTYGGAIAMGMAVDVVDPDPINGIVDVFVAMGPHGLARVRLSIPILAGQSPATVDWGPVFGDGTHYATQVHDRYDNYQMVIVDDRYDPPLHLVERDEPPVFRDVAVQNDTHGHYLYSAVEHLNWVRFDLANAWADDMTIEHHEGADLENDWGEDQMQLVPDIGNGESEYCYAAHLDLVEHPTHGPILTVTGNRGPFWKMAWQYTEGPPLDTSVEGGGTSAHAGGDVRTAFYRIQDDANWNPVGSYNLAAWVEYGGSMLCLPSQQSNPDTKILDVFHHVQVDIDGKPLGTCKLGVDISAPGPATMAATPSYVLIRNELEAVGAHCFTVGFSEISPQLVLTGIDDAGSRHDGFLVTKPGVGEEVEFLVRTPSPGFADPAEGEMLPLLGETQGGQWTHPTIADQFIVIGERLNPTPDYAQIVANVVHVNTADAADDMDHPYLDKHVFLDGVKDRFDWTGRAYYMSAGHSALMDAQYQDLTGAPKKLVALSRGLPTVEGVIVLDREKWNTGIVSAGSGDELLALNYQEAILDTHPEYDRMPFTTDQQEVDDAQNWWKGGNPNGTVKDYPGAHGAVFNWPPKFMLVEGDPGQLNAWVLAVPCGKVWYDPTWPGLEQYPDWTPDSYWLDKKGQAMVQFWPIVVVDDHLEVERTATPLADEGNNTRLPRLFGPNEGMAVRLESVLLDDASGNQSSYCIVSDFGGRVLIKDITEILSGTVDDAWSADWIWDAIPPSTLDTRYQNIASVAVDRFSDQVAYLYVAIRRTGIQVLSFEPGALEPDNRLKEEVLIQTGGDPWDLVVRVDGVKKHLIVTDAYGGVRVFGD